jgi:orotidine-5'-phosphate decarboxylase
MAVLSQKRRVYVHFADQNAAYRDRVASGTMARAIEEAVGTQVIGTDTFRERLTHAAGANDSLLCIGLDPDHRRFPSPLHDDNDIATAIIAFNAAVITATSDLVCAYKPNLGFYLAYGGAGIAALEQTRRLVPPHIPIILDAKTGDMDNTAAAYATGFFDTWEFDAVTVSPYLGEDSLAPFMRRAERGVIVVCKTSNPGSGDLQDLRLEGDGQPLFLTVADRVAAWSERWPATLGLVVGATYPAELAEVRRRCPEAPILLPGIGAQGGDLEGSLRAGLDARGAGLIVSASRAVTYAGSDRGANWPDAVRATALGLRNAINEVRATVGS